MVTGGLGDRVLAFLHGIPLAAVPGGCGLVDPVDLILRHAEDLLHTPPVLGAEEVNDGVQIL